MTEIAFSKLRLKQIIRKVSNCHSVIIKLIFSYYFIQSKTKQTQTIKVRDNILFKEFRLATPIICQQQQRGATFTSCERRQTNSSLIWMDNEESQVKYLSLNTRRDEGDGYLVISGERGTKRWWGASSSSVITSSGVQTPLPIVTKAQQCLFFLRKFNAWPPLLNSFYRCTIESLLTELLLHSLAWDPRCWGWNGSSEDGQVSPGQIRLSVPS